MRLAWMCCVKEEEDEHSGLSSDEDDAFDALFEPTATVDLAAVAAAETRQVVMILKLVFEFLPPRDLKTSTLFVSPTWHRSSVSALSWYIGTTVASKTRSFADDIDFARLSSAALYRMRVSFAETFPWGRFLCRGGYKSVYKVWCAPRKRLGAVSVMDVDLISWAQRAHCAARTHVGTLLSDLVTSGGPSTSLRPLECSTALWRSPWTCGAQRTERASSMEKI